MTDLLAFEATAVGDGLEDRHVPGPEDGLDQELVCVDAIWETHDVRSLVLDASRVGYAGFRPGQYLTVRVEIDGVPLERCYSIASSPTRPERVTLTVKRVPGGPVSTWLHDHFGVGDRLQVRGPLGRFSMLEHPAPTYLFLSAGSGITPLMSMTRALQDLPEAREVAFVHSARSPADLIFRDELEAMAAAHDWLSVTTVCEDDAPGETWSGPRGRLTRQLLEAAVPDLAEREVFTCGPEPYRQAVRGLLASVGADPGRCHEESYVLAGAPAASAVPVAPGSAPDIAPVGTGFAVEFRKSGRVVRCDPGSTLLEAALRAGVGLAFSCGEGMCGTCKSTLLEGSVDMRHAGGIRPREIAQDQILVCCSTPLDDLVIDA